MKRLIFLLLAFVCGLTASIAADVGTKHADMLQNPFVITQITTMPVMNAVVFESVPTVYNTSTVVQANRSTLIIQTFKEVAVLHVDPGRYIQVSVNKFNFKDTFTNNSYSYTPYLTTNYKLSTLNCQLFLPTARHVTFS